MMPFGICLVLVQGDGLLSDGAMPLPNTIDLSSIKSVRPYFNEILINITEILL